jgi:hypothetical protein
MTTEGFSKLFLKCLRKGPSNKKHSNETSKNLKDDRRIFIFLPHVCFLEYNKKAYPAPASKHNNINQGENCVISFRLSIINKINKGVLQKDGLKIK